MNNYFQLAAGNSVSEEALEYIVTLNPSSIEEGIKAAFNEGRDYLGTYKGYELSDVDAHGYYQLTISYIDEFQDEEVTRWQLRPVKFFP